MKTIYDFHAEATDKIYCLFTLDEVRKEAVDNVNRLLKTVNRIKTTELDNSYKYIRIGHLIAKIDWIKMFFNITEDDLNDNEKHE